LKYGLGCGTGREKGREKRKKKKRFLARLPPTRFQGFSQRKKKKKGGQGTSSLPTVRNVSNIEERKEKRKRGEGGVHCPFRSLSCRVEKRGKKDRGRASHSLRSRSKEKRKRDAVTPFNLAEKEKKNSDQILFCPPPTPWESEKRRNPNGFRNIP